MNTASSLPEWANAHPRELMEEHGLRPQHHLGQNFLVGSTNLDRVVESAQLRRGEVVLEIGTGLGRLTARLAELAEHVLTVEVDEATARAARQHLADYSNVTILCCDFLARKHAINPVVTAAMANLQDSTGRPVRVVANLPYGISSPAIVNMLEWEVPVAEMCLMVQKEVADRLVAEPGTSDYGPLTVFTHYWADVSRLYNLGKNTFWPAPSVASSLVRITRTRPQAQAKDYEAFVRVVRRLLTMRRKTLRKALKNGWNLRDAGNTLSALGLDENMRPEQLSVAQFEHLSALIGPPPR